MSYYSKGLPWSSGIGKDVKDCTSAREVMQKAGLDFNVEKCELVAKMPFRINGINTIEDGEGFSYGGNIYREVPNQYGTYRTDINVPLGLVKQKYEIVQNIDAFNFFDEAIGEGKALWQTAGLFGYGEKIFVSAKLPITTNVNGDEIDNYLVFSNSHDGSSSLNILFTPIRVFCTNCLASAFKNADAYIRIKHTRTVKERLDEGAKILKIACEYAQQASELYKSLTVIGMSDDKVARYFCGLILTPEEFAKVESYDKAHGFRKLISGDWLIKEATEISTRKVNKLISMFNYYVNGIGQQHIIGTAWGAYNAVTGYCSNVDNKNGEDRMNSLLYGGGATLMTKALNDVVEYKAA